MKKIVLFFVFSYISCNVCPDGTTGEPFSLEYRSYAGSNLRLEGYYYTVLRSDDLFDIYFLYPNGIVRELAFSEVSNVIDLDNKIEGAREFYENNQVFYDWGIFVVDSNFIQVERWYPGSSNCIFPAYIRSGKILNDTTFYLTETYKLDEYGDKYDIGEARCDTFHFKEFEHKLDSTNSFIP